MFVCILCMILWLCSVWVWVRVVDGVMLVWVVSWVFEVWLLCWSSCRMVRLMVLRFWLGWGLFGMWFFGGGGFWGGCGYCVILLKVVWCDSYFVVC